MATIEIRRAHRLSSTDARGRAEHFAERIRQRLDVRWRWEGNRLAFDAPTGVARGATGLVTLREGEVHVSIDLPLFLRPMKRTVEDRLRDKLDALLARPA